MTAHPEQMYVHPFRNPSPSLQFSNIVHFSTNLLVQLRHPDLVEKKTLSENEIVKRQHKKMGTLYLLLVSDQRFSMPHLPYESKKNAKEATRLSQHK